MLISKAKQKIVLNVRDPQHIQTVIPAAKSFEYKGHELLAVPHDLHTTRVLRGMGIQAPSPIKYHYQWSGQNNPFHAQLETTEFLTFNDRAFVLNDMGTGKTLSVLWAFDYLRKQGLASKMLVVSPLSTLERTWADEVFRHFPHLTVSVLYGAKARRQKMLAMEADIYLINHDGVKVMEKELAARTDITTIVVDEIASFRNASTSRWKALRKVIDGRKYVWGLTGTPTPNAPTDAWAQCRLVCPDNVPPYFGKFRDSVMKQISQFKWMPRENATDVVAQAMQPSIRFTRDQCVDLPPCIYQSRDVPLSKEQSTAYKDMLSRLKFEMDNNEVMAVNEAVKLSKLLQICCGAAYDGKGNPVTLDITARIQEVIEVIEQADSKTLVFVPFTAALEQVATELRKHWHTGVIHGGTPKSARDDIFSEFQSGKDMRVLVANPGTLSHGLTLTAANTIVWFGPPVSAEQYEQANARVTRPGQKNTQFIVHIEGTPVERRVYERLRNKRQIQGLLLEILQG